MRIYNLIDTEKGNIVAVVSSYEVAEACLRISFSARSPVITIKEVCIIEVACTTGTFRFMLEPVDLITCGQYL